ncbi:MAG: hypothetical protein JW860_00870 [Sedimentisphaerales bacterium]|nr:hypothetical protein [Sedimentisphaerales bacterium]
MNSYSIKFFSVVVCFGLFFSISLASTWDPPVDSDLNWCNSANWWFNDGPPTSTDTALINATDEGAARIGAGCYASAGSLIISQFDYLAEVKVYPGGSLHVYGDTILGNYSATGTLEIHDQVTIDGNLTVGYYISPRGFGHLKMQGGWLSVGGDLDLGDQGGYGTMEMNGGTINITGTFGMLNGHIQLNDGIIYAEDLSFISPYGTFDIRGNGTLLLWQDLSGTYGHSIDSITACNGQGTVIKDFYVNATVVRTECVCPAEDVTGDCIVNLLDLAALAQQWLAGAN